MAKIKIAVLFGGSSSEHDVSLASATSVISNIPEDKYEVIKLGITKKGRWLYYPGPVELIKDGRWETYADCVPAFISPDRTTKGIIKLESKGFTIQKIDVVFPVLHGKNGEDGTVQGLLELAGIPYVGCDVVSSAVCMDKSITNMMLDHAGVQRAPWRYLNAQDLPKLDALVAEIETEFGYPVFVKPANAGSSVGVTKAHNREELHDAVKIALANDNKIIFEKNIIGQEIECAVLGNWEPIASIPGEVFASNEFYDYEAKYHSAESRTTIPALLSEQKLKEVQHVALKVYKLLGCSGLARVDFFVEKATGDILLNEINTLPGFTDISMYPKMMQASGYTYPELIDAIITYAFEQKEVSYE